MRPRLKATRPNRESKDSCRRILTEEELQQAFSVRKKVFVEEQNVPLHLEMDEYDVSPKACRHFLAESEGMAVGAARWREYEPGTAKLQRIAVLEPYRGRGVGKLRVESMEKDAAVLGCGKVILDAQCSAEGFYRRLGYVTEFEAPFLDAGIPHVRMSKPLHV